MDVKAQSWAILGVSHREFARSFTHMMGHGSWEIIQDYLWCSRQEELAKMLGSGNDCTAAASKDG